MATSPEEATRGRGRPRTPGAEKKIIDAALEEYGERGWSGFTMDGVARRAGVGKSTVYLRWQDKDSLLTDAVGTRSGDLGSVDTGSLRGDLEALAVNLFDHFQDPAGWASLRVTIDAAGSSAPLGRFTEAVSDVQLDFVDQIVARAVRRGEVPDSVIPSSIAQCVYGAVVMLALGFRLRGRVLDDDEVRERARRLTSVVLDGVLD